MSPDETPDHSRCQNDCLDRGPVAAWPDDPEEEILAGRLISRMSAPGVPVERVAVGRRFVGVLAGDRLGVASTLGATPDNDDSAMTENLVGRPLADAANLLTASKSGFGTSIGLAAMNAGLDFPPIDTSLNAGALLEELAQGRKVVIVGDFPFVDGVKKAALSLYLLELRPASGATPQNQWDTVLNDCQVAAITSTALVSRSLAYFLRMTPNALRVLIGPSTPMTPLLFDLGADILAGCRYTDPEAVMAAIERDATFREIKRAGVELICCLRKPITELTNCS
jgi:uncharacterized protein (DUF4213/DUF364 family)